MILPRTELYLVKILCTENLHCILADTFMIYTSKSQIQTANMMKCRTNDKINKIEHRSNTVTHTMFDTRISVIAKETTSLSFMSF